MALRPSAARLASSAAGARYERRFRADHIGAHQPIGAAIRESHVALSMQNHLDDLAREAGVTPEWKQLLRDLDRLFGELASVDPRMSVCPCR